jgi:signal transduction histidine kinase/ActR/RegA family two-component response regulator
MTVAVAPSAPAPGTTALPAAAGDDTSNLDLRFRLLMVALNLVSFATTLISLILIVQSTAMGRSLARTLFMSSLTLLFPLLRLATPRLRFRTSATLFLILVAAMAFLIQVNGGITVASTMLSIIAVLLAGIFFGPRGSVLMLLTSLASFIVAGILVVKGLAHVTQQMWNPLHTEVWIRSGIAYVLFGSAITAAVVYVVQRLEAEAARLRQALARNQIERLAREKAEAERETERAHRREAQEALAQAQRSEALGRMAGGIAHDFNNALTVIMNAAGLGLLERGVPEGVRGSLSDIEFAAQRAAKLTKELLVFAKRDVAHPRALRVDEWLDRLAGSLRGVLPASTMLTIDARSAAVIQLDETQFERVIMNLTVNARDAIGNRGGKIGIAARTVQGKPAGTCHAIISISDDGDGMDDTTRSRIFEPFFTTKDHGKGTGLGLALVESIVREAGGFVVVASAPGRGSIFEVHMPSQADGGSPASLPGPSMPAPAAAARRTARLLVVDDRHDVRIAMSRALAHAGFEVETAADGDQALATLERLGGAIDLLCIDAVMPGISTATVIDRACADVPGLKVLLCSGHVEAELLRRGIAAGKYSFLQKPFTSLELIDRVHRELGHQN